MANTRKTNKARQSRKLARVAQGLVPREGWQTWYDLKDQAPPLAIAGVRYGNQRRFRMMLKVHERRVNRRQQEAQARTTVAMEVRLFRAVCAPDGTGFDAADRSAWLCLQPQRR
jgi:hypothetical protein